MNLPQTGRATAAVAASYAYMAALKKPFTEAQQNRLPAGLTQTDFNFLDPKAKLARANIILMSASQYIDKNSGSYLDPITDTGATVIGDNGAFRIKTDPTYYQGPQTAERVLRWMEEHSHMGPILDIPTSAIGPGKQFTTFDQAFQASLANASAMLKARDDNKNFKLLNVMQGRTVPEFKTWYHAFKKFDLQGWAIGGARRLDFACLYWLLWQWKNDGLLDQVEWVHVFGTFRLEMALGLTAFKRVLDAAAGREIPVTIDASTPMTQALKYFRIYSRQKFDGDRLPMEDVLLPTHKKHAGTNTPFPAQGSAISKLVTLGDICVDHGQFGKVYGWDDISRLIAVNHNIDFLFSTLDSLHGHFESDWNTARHHIPNWLLDLEAQGNEILNSQDPEKALKKKSHHLGKLVAEKYA